MNIFSLALTILGLALFETVSSIDNAIVNAEVLTTMRPKARRWFLVWGLLFAVFVIRGVLPWIIVWTSNPRLGALGALTATFSSDPSVLAAINLAAPILLAGGGLFLVLLFLHWLFCEDKNIGLPHESFFLEQSVWFYAVASVALLVVVWFGMRQSPYLAFGAIVGSTAFFITHGFKQSAEQFEKKLVHRQGSDVSKILYLEIIDASFSVDGVLGAFAFTLSVPLIILGNGLGALIVRRLTVGNMEAIKKYVFLKNGAMYSILFLGLIMVLDAFRFDVPGWVSPLITFVTVGYFFRKSRIHARQSRI
jgi:hypothetical protein